MRKLSHEEIVSRQMAASPKDPLPFIVVLNNIRSLYNVGAIFRTADGVGVQKVWLCGITGYPPQSQISKTALGAEGRVEWDYAEDVLSVVRDLKAKHYKIVLLEQMDDSMDYQKFKPEGPVCLVVGNEVSGISNDLVSLCDAAVEIEMAGLKNSLNIGVAFGVVAYHIRHCLRRV